jgi:DNA-binding response OmpR family regulator
MTDTHTLLIVEDETLVREMLCDKFEHAGYRVVGAADGHVGLRALEEHSIQLVISDLLMPRQDGLELLMQVRDKWPDIPFIAITAPSNLLYLEVASRLGAAETFEKPIDLGQLEAAVKTLIRPIQEQS